MGVMRIGVMALAVTMAGCSSVDYGPKPEEMRQALLDMLDKQPDISIPEFRNSLEHDKAVLQDGIVYIGSWNCDPQLGTFDAVFSAPNITMYEISGRFQMDNRGIWCATPIPRVPLKVQNRDVGEFWRPNEVEPR